MVETDYISILEAAYRVDADEESWLGGLTSAAEKSVAGGRGAWALLYDLGDPEQARVLRFQCDAALPGFVAGVMARLLVACDANGVRPSFGRASCALASETPAAYALSALPGASRADPDADILGLNGSDPSGRGVFVGIHLSDHASLSEQQRMLWSRIAAHAATAYRLRRRISAEEPALTDPMAGAEAILDAGGKFLHAAPAATRESARRSLREAVVALDRSRGRLRKKAPAAAVEQWKGLVAARWTLLEHFDRDGRRYMVARQNGPTVPPFELLTERERQVVAFASLGHPNKLIAYELGLATSTIGVLISRAMARLGLSSRKALIAAWRARRES